MSEAYEKMTVVELKKLIKERGLTASGKKADLVACLYEDDKGTDGASAPRKTNKRKADEDEEEEAPSKKVKQSKAKMDEETNTRGPSARVKGQKQKEEKDETSIGKWKNSGSLYYLSSSSLVHSSKIASFDMDDTLIETQSGRTFALGRSDWQWLYDEIPTKLKELNKQGVKVVIFTNQSGITTKGFDNAKLSAISGKIEDLSAELGFPIQAFIATADDEYRKPATAMWDFMVKNLNGGIVPDLEESIFVGDAAGRAAGWKENRKKDFSCSDRKFAKNIGIKFATPEEYFLNEPSAAFEWGSFEIASIPVSGDAEITEGGEATLTTSSQEMVLFVGFPASGKSTLAKRYMIPKGYVHVNRDTLKTPAKCLKVAEDAISDGKSVVVDNTNPDKASRAAYIDLAKEAGIPVRCFRFEVDEKLAQHLNYFRERLGISPHVPRIGYNMYKKKFQEPTLSEGFSEVKKIKFVKKFEHQDHEKLFEQQA